MQPNTLRALLLLLCTAATSTLVGNAIVRGRMKNANIGDRIEIYVPHYYLDNDANSYKVQLDGQLEFQIDAYITEPQLVFLVFGQDQLPIFLDPGDTLLVKADMFQFPVMVEFGGKAAANNKLLSAYAKTQLTDYNEFNNVRFKIGQWWFSLESSVNEQMLALPRPEFIAWANEKQKESFAVYDRFMEAQSDMLSLSFREWIESEIIFTRAYHLLMYGAVYKNRYQIEDEYFDFLQEIPMVVSAIGSEAYRQYLQVYMARLQVNNGLEDRFYRGQYDFSGTLLEGKSLAFFRSEIIKMAFSSDRFQEILPAYNDFLRHNTYPEYEPKITALYERTSRFAPGIAAPSFGGKDYYTASNFTNTSLSGKVIYLNFWATWCGACVKKMDFFNAFSPELAAAGVVIVNISIDENEANWSDALVANRMAGYHLLAKSYPEQAMAATFGVQAVPQYFIIGANGMIAQKPYSNQPNDILNRLIEVAKGK